MVGFFTVEVRSRKNPAVVNLPMGIKKRGIFEPEVQKFPLWWGPNLGARGKILVQLCTKCKIGEEYKPLYWSVSTHALI